MRSVNSRNTLIAIIVTLSAALALADDFKPINGKEYKNATISRVESNGIVVKFSGGIVKIPFAELPKDVQERYNRKRQLQRMPSTWLPRNRQLDGLRNLAVS